MWVTENNDLRIHRILRQGDLCIPIGDYIEISDETFWHHCKQFFENQCTLINGNG